ncbi:MAG: ABC transporter substrate-binding protein [Microbacteriaceae bacterium]
MSPGIRGPLLQNPSVHLPTTVTSYDRGGNRQITVTDTSRVLALSMNGNLASMVYALGLGDQLIARDVVTDEPELEHLPIVTRAGHSIEAETIIGLNPSLIISDGSIGPLDVVIQLREAGITVVFVERDSSFEGSYRIAQQVGDALGSSEAGTELSNLLREEIEQKSAEIQRLVPQDAENQLRIAFLYLRGAAKIYYLFGAESGADTLIHALGGVDIATELGWVGMRPVTDEALIELNPDLLLLMSDGLQSVGGVDGLFETLPALKLTQAGINRRVVDMADTEVLSFGVDMAGVLDALARAIYAPGQ